MQAKYRTHLEKLLERYSEPVRQILRPLLLNLWRWYLGRSLNRFTEEVLGYNNAEHQREWYSILENAKLHKIVLAAPRNHAKTTAISVNYVLWRISKNHNVRILMVSNTESQAQASLRQIVGRVERDQMYVDFAGQLRPEKPEKWTDKEIIIKREAFDMKDPTISTVGVGGTILSKRADEIICDDLLNPENTRTPDQRRKMAEWFHQVLLPVLIPGGRVIVAGTVWHPQDLLNELLADAGWDYRRKFQAVMSWPSNMQIWQDWYAIRMKGTPESTAEAEQFFITNYKVMHEGVHVLWPEYFAFASLYLIWRSNRVAFEKAYQNNIVSREDQKFKEEWLIRALERGAGYRLVLTLSADQRKEFKILTGGIDLAASESEQSDDNAMISLGQRRLDDMVALLALDRGKFSPADWRKLMVERYEGLLHDRIVVESNGYQIALTRDLAGKNLPVVAFNTGGEKLDPYIGVESLAILFENDRIILPYDKSDPYTVSVVQQLVDELRQFPVGHTGDSAMALWFAYTAMRDMAGAASSGFLQMIQKDVQALKEKGGAPGLKSWVDAARKQQ